MQIEMRRPTQIKKIFLAALISGSRERLDDLSLSVTRQLTAENSYAEHEFLLTRKLKQSPANFSKGYEAIMARGVCSLSNNAFDEPFRDDRIKELKKYRNLIENLEVDDRAYSFWANIKHMTKKRTVGIMAGAAIPLTYDLSSNFNEASVGLYIVMGYAGMIAGGIVGRMENNKKFKQSAHKGLKQIDRAFKSLR